jgi:hypothetical protein
MATAIDRFIQELLASGSDSTEAELNEALAFALPPTDERIEWVAIVVMDTSPFEPELYSVVVHCTKSDRAEAPVVRESMRECVRYIAETY